MAQLVSAFGLSSSAGLNAYIPLLVVGLLGRYTGLIKLDGPFDLLTSPWAIAVLVVLLAIETFVDKIPAVNHVNDAVQTIIRPAAGAILFASSTHAISQVDPVFALVCGLVVTGGVHTVKSVAIRPAVTATTGGLGNPVVSTIEDGIALGTSLLAVVVPILLLLIALFVAALVVWWLRRRQIQPGYQP